MPVAADGVPLPLKVVLPLVPFVPAAPLVPFIPLVPLNIVGVPQAPATFGPYKSPVFLSK
ncbi:MAG: hypothetical protein EOO92_20530 [Pedobacter sp.]|nr:MAG: hypothetical protein EOO92_20530 [Pedobacter sp.]